MSFQIQSLPAGPFQQYFNMSDEELHKNAARRVFADADQGYPCRVSMADAKEGDELVLVNYQHLDGTTPYAATHAIYVRKGVDQAKLSAGEVPEVLTCRLLSLRGFDAEGLMQAAEVVDGAEASDTIERIFADPMIEVIHIHNAKAGCFAASAIRDNG